ncbi:MAG: hypothetical protein JSS89_05300 [Bacteroidetes bacterium]|nr:hypothetical protein [Bacteroidota bacterium]
MKKKHTFSARISGFWKRTDFSLTSEEREEESHPGSVTEFTSTVEYSGFATLIFICLICLAFAVAMICLQKAIGENEECRAQCWKSGAIMCRDSVTTEIVMQSVCLHCPNHECKGDRQINTSNRVKTKRPSLDQKVDTNRCHQKSTVCPEGDSHE